MNRRRFLFSALPSGLLVAAAPTIFLPPRGGWPSTERIIRVWENGKLVYDGSREEGNIDLASLAALTRCLTASDNTYNVVCYTTGNAANKRLSFSWE